MPPCKQAQWLTLPGRRRGPQFADTGEAGPSWHGRSGSGPAHFGPLRGFNPGTAFVAPAAQAPASEVPAAARRGLKRVWQLRQ